MKSWNRNKKPKAMDLMPALAMKRFYNRPPKRFGLWGVLIFSNILWISMVLFLTTVTWTSTKLGTALTEFYFKERNKWIIQKEAKEKELEQSNLQVARLVSLQTSSPGDVVRLAGKISKVLNSSSGSHRAFIEQALPEAIRIQVQFGIPASATISQAIYESGYGASALAKGYHNYFGIKAFSNWNGPRATSMPTVDSGVKTRADFRAYATLGEGFEGYAKFLKDSGRYEKAFHSPSGLAFVHTILKAGYCPDSTYLSAIQKIMQKHNLVELDDIIKAGADAPYQSAWTSSITKEQAQEEAKLSKITTQNKF
jgi:flagellum-specific peptidoglycan hydrolase FlgJ